MTCLLTGIEIVFLVIEGVHISNDSTIIISIFIKHILLIITYVSILEFYSEIFIQLILPGSNLKTNKFGLKLIKIVRGML